MLNNNTLKTKTILKTRIQYTICTKEDCVIPHIILAYVKWLGSNLCYVVIRDKGNAVNKMHKTTTDWIRFAYKACLLAKHITVLSLIYGDGQTPTAITSDC